MHLKRNLFLPFSGFQYVNKATVNLKILSNKYFCHFAGAENAVFPIKKCQEAVSSFIQIVTSRWLQRFCLHSACLSNALSSTEKCLVTCQNLGFRTALLVVKVVEEKQTRITMWSATDVTSRHEITW